MSESCSYMYLHYCARLPEVTDTGPARGGVLTIHVHYNHNNMHDLKGRESFIMYAW